MSKAIEAFDSASGISATNLADLIIVSFFGFLLITVAYIAIHQFKEVENGGKIQVFARTLIRAVFIVIICGVFLI